MKVSVDVCLRGNDYATTEEIEGVSREPRDWIDEDVRTVLEGMLRAMDRSRRPGEAARGVLLRGLSWIVNPFEEGGVVIAIEITLGAAVAGPFEIERATLEAMITRVIAQAAPPSASIH